MNSNRHESEQERGAMVALWTWTLAMALLPWTDAHSLPDLVDGLTPDAADTFADFPAWVASRLEIEKTEAG